MEEKRERNRYRSQEKGSEGGTYLKESKRRYKSIKRKMKTERKLYFKEGTERDIKREGKICERKGKVK